MSGHAVYLHPRFISRILGKQAEWMHWLHRPLVHQTVIADGHCCLLCCCPWGIGGIWPRGHRWCRGVSNLMVSLLLDWWHQGDYGTEEWVEEWGRSKCLKRIGVRPGLGDNNKHFGPCSSKLILLVSFLFRSSCLAFCQSCLFFYSYWLRKVLMEQSQLHHL